MKQLLNTHERLIRLPDVKLKTGLGRTSIYMKMKDRSFPLCINLGGRSVAWVESEIDAWIANKIKESRIPNTQHIGKLATDKLSKIAKISGIKVNKEGEDDDAAQ